MTPATEDIGSFRDSGV